MSATMDPGVCRAAHRKRREVLTEEELPRYDSLCSACSKGRSQPGRLTWRASMWSEPLRAVLPSVSSFLLLLWLMVLLVSLLFLRIAASACLPQVAFVCNASCGLRAGGSGGRVCLFILRGLFLALFLSSSPSFLVCSPCSFPEFSVMGGGIVTFLGGVHIHACHSYIPCIYV